MFVLPPRRASRRAVLGLGLAAATAVSGCSSTGTESAPPLDASPSNPSNPTTSPAGSAGAGATDAAAADTALVTLLVEEISRAHALVRANRRAHPLLATDLLALEHLHARHAAELGGLVPVAASTVRTERRQDRVRPRLVSVEERLQRRLVDDSVAAGSGALALLVAAMAAGVAQQASLL